MPGTQPGFPPSGLQSQSSMSGGPPAPNAPAPRPHFSTEHREEGTRLPTLAPPSRPPAPRSTGQALGHRPPMKPWAWPAPSQRKPRRCTQAPGGERGTLNDSEKPNHPEREGRALTHLRLGWTHLLDALAACQAGRAGPVTLGARERLCPAPQGRAVRMAARLSGPTVQHGGGAACVWDNRDRQTMRARASCKLSFDLSRHK